MIDQPVSGLLSSMSGRNAESHDSQRGSVFRSRFSQLLGIMAGAALSCFSSDVTSAQEPAAESTTAVAGDLFQFPPATPARLVEAAKITQQLDRFDDARAFLRHLIERQLTDDELRGLRRELGVSSFVDLNTDARLQPEARELLGLINAASRQEPLNTDQLKILVQELGQPEYAAADAVSRLFAAGDAAVPALLAADPQTAAGRVAAELLQSRTRQFRAGLLAQMAASDAATRIRIINLLSSTADSEIALRLLRWQFDPHGEDAVSDAARSAIRRLRLSLEAPTSATEAADLLTGNAGQLIEASGARFTRLEGTAAMRELTGADPRAEALANASLLLQDALVVDPDNRSTRRMILVADCAAASPSMNAEATVAEGKAPDEILAALDSALELNHPAAAIELLRGLSRVADAQFDLTEAGRVLRLALNSPDMRVRLFAAHLAKNQLPVEVSQPAVARTLSSAADGSILPEVVIAGADRIQSGVLRAVLEDAGYSVAETATGVEGFDVAVRQMNCELFILSAESNYWPLTTTIANLRADIRTRNTPIIVIGSSRFEARVKSLAENYDGVRFITGPAGAETLQTTAQEIDVPESVDAAIARRNKLWMLTMQSLELPGVVLTPGDREILKALAN